MSAIVLDIVWRGAAWAVAGLGLALILYALFADAVRAPKLRRRARGATEPTAARPGAAPPAPRLRCPGSWGRVLLVLPWRHGCWYDMSAAAPGDDGRYQCPECGRRSTARRLRKPRRRYRLAFVGLLVVGVGLGGRYGRELHRRGWKAVPDAVLVLVPFDERVLLEGSPNSSSPHPLVQDAIEEIQRRELWGTLRPWASRRLGLRIRDRYQRDPDYGVDGASRAAFARLESTMFPAGLERIPLREALEAIAGTAGVRLAIDDQALSVGSIDLNRPITIPAFGPMSCAQALDWACDRGRASRGWETATWDVVDGSVHVTTAAATHARKRHLVFVRAGVENPWWPEVSAVALAQLSPRVHTVHMAGDALVLGTHARRLLIAERSGRIAGDARGLEWRRDQIELIDQRLRLQPIVPIGADDTARVLLRRIEAELDLPVSIDPWGLDLDTTLGDLAAARARENSDRTGHDADPFGTSAREVEVEPITNAFAALTAFGLDFTHDGHTLAVALGASQLLATQAAFKLPEGGPLYIHPDGWQHLDAAGLRRFEWQTRIVSLIGSMRGGQTGRPFTWGLYGDRLIIEAPPDVQVLVAPIVDEAIRDWEADLRGQD